MTPRLRVRPGARAEIRAARRWYEGESRGLGRAFVAEVDAALAFALRHPEMYEAPEADNPALRRALLHRFPYALVYEIVPAAAPRGVVGVGPGAPRVRCRRAGWQHAAAARGPSVGRRTGGAAAGTGPAVASGGVGALATTG